MALNTLKALTLCAFNIVYMSKKKSNACHTHYFFHLLYFQLLYNQVYSCIQQISKLWSLFLLDPHTDCSVLIVCTAPPPPPPPPCLPLLLMKGLSLLPHFQKEDLDMTLREGGFTCQWGGALWDRGNSHIHACSC